MASPLVEEGRDDGPEDFEGHVRVDDVAAGADAIGKRMRVSGQRWFEVPPYHPGLAVIMRVSGPVRWRVSGSSHIGKSLGVVILEDVDQAALGYQELAVHVLHGAAWGARGR